MNLHCLSQQDTQAQVNILHQEETSEASQKEATFRRERHKIHFFHSDKCETDWDCNKEKKHVCLFNKECGKSGLKRDGYCSHPSHCRKGQTCIMVCVQITGVTVTLLLPYCIFQSMGTSEGECYQVASPRGHACKKHSHCM